MGLYTKTELGGIELPHGFVTIDCIDRGYRLYVSHRELHLRYGPGILGYHFSREAPEHGIQVVYGSARAPQQGVPGAHTYHAIEGWNLDRVIPDVIGHEKIPPGCDAFIFTAFAMQLGLYDGGFSALIKTPKNVPDHHAWRLLGIIERVA